VIVQGKAYEPFLAKLSAAAGRLRLGDGLKNTTDVGPLVNEKGLNKVLNYIRIGQEEGAHLHTGGVRATEKTLARGFFVEPTVFSSVTAGMRIAQEEIFGPVVAVLKCSSFEEGVKLVNSTRFGLSSAIYTRSVNLAARAERELESGIVYINASTIGAEIQLPFGGFKHSGSGHPEAGGRMGALDFFSRIKTVYRDYSGRLQKAQIDVE
ncbi:MAG TPA: aldehyde dehydrogenase family protein, partial [Desulfuromonadales bacterium]|nr:aldehyde dehydrogenase family protein [Desulfuromonadales bacterium]